MESQFDFELVITELQEFGLVNLVFSHSNSIDRMMVNSDLLCDIENVVSDLITELEKDTLHYEELCKSLN